jgi:hypothetical protein
MSSDHESDALSHPHWHALLGPLPAEAVPVRKPVAPPEVLESKNGWAVAGWEQLSIHLSAGLGGLRHILVVLDAGGTLLSASDAVLYRSGVHGGPPPADVDAPATILQMSVGGRFEEDGSFHGTRWQSVAVDRGEEELDWESTPSAPSPADVESLRLLVAEVIRRQPSRG